MEVLAMAKRLGSSELPLVYQRGFEPSRVEAQLWSKAYEEVLPEPRRGPRKGADSAVPGSSRQAQKVPVVSHSLEEKCA